MLKDITLGQYYPTNSRIHKLDPRVKIMFTFVFMVTIFMINKFYPYLFIVAFLTLLAKTSKIPGSYLIKGVRPLWPLLIITFFINALLTQGEVLWSLWVFKFTLEGLRLGGFMIIRLVLLIVGTSLLTLTTSPIELTDGIEKLLNPFKKIGLPAHEIAMMMTIALRFIPTLLEETDKIMKAQMARGADFESRNLVERAKSLVPLLVPLFISAFRRADELAMAMESRCYRGGEGRTRMNEISLDKSDYRAFIISTVIMIMIASTRFINFGM
ncbi:MAG: energy-coupling factor transporter transmembrane component T [Proteocatella sp.]